MDQGFSRPVNKLVTRKACFSELMTDLSCAQVLRQATLQNSRTKSARIVGTDIRRYGIGKLNEHKTIQDLPFGERLVDTKAWRVNLKAYRPVARFGASFYITTNDRFAISDNEGEAPQTNSAIDQM